MILRAADGLTRAAGALGTLCFGAVIVVMLFEVVARYVFAAPHIWTTETVAMLNGVGFLFAAGLALREGAHVGIDVAARRLPARLRGAILAAFLLLVFAPLLLWLLDVAATRTLTALATGEVDDVSPWRRPVWPFHAALAAGLFCFAVSVAAEGLRQAGRALRG